MSHELAAATQVLASNCCICGRDLCDAKSVELGTGPVCRKRYFRDADIPIDNDGWARALGVVAQSGLPEHIIDGVLDRRPDTRLAANLVVYWASAHHTDRKTVLTCSNIVRFLGYTTLADKLERDRSDLRFETEGDEIHIYCKRNDRFGWDIRRRLNGKIIRHEASNRFKCWAVPTNRKASLILLAGVYFGGFKCWADGGIFTVELKTRAEFDASLPKASKASKTAKGLPTGCKVTEKGRCLYIETPYNGAFVGALRGVRGRRYEGEGVNSFPLSERSNVLNLIQQHYGDSA